ncbi:hypothetical protein COEREDRAFT_81536 [Coemansia reversa NRRL 1564]|uniref:DNA-directed RNA polymerase III subunit RPC5 n=1 Tax=Coemansia reversa (strain ATCC 12441 / NRRL 1564) TaxID=763665 RepID=A0A2G5BAR0_COERN|nr:hypothetical protein COEREDRAFT_81536 [Coemansia reversa NRRL 1564]|eukprot:PIA16093.1 hypothetical protein COEREDRAFT_81536 [Coemansia reversa NRRL 1564]
MSVSDTPSRSAAEYGLPDDEIVAEIPVYLTQKLDKQLHLLQYPQKDGSITPGELQPREARIKPIHGQIELDIPLDVQSPMYNKERGAELGAGISDSGRLLDITTLVSVGIPQNSEYLAGVMRDGELHLTAIKKAIQLRPSLRYLDRVAEKNLAVKRMDYSDDEEEVKKDAKTQSVQVTVRSAQAEEALRQQQSSIAYMQQKLEEEPWSELAYFDVGTEESSAMHADLVAENKEDLISKTSPDEYLTAVIGSIEPDVM